jgi:hypothetical protein
MRVVTFVLLLLVAACTRVPSISDAQAQAVEGAAASLLGEACCPDVPQGKWSPELRALNPKAVRVDNEGVYVVTGGWFVEEAGFFVPRHPETFVPVDGDPEYKRIHGAVFSYRVRG